VSVSWNSIVAGSVPIFVDSTIQQSHFSDGELLSKSHIFLDWNTFFHDISIVATSKSLCHGQVATDVQVAGGLAQGAVQIDHWQITGGFHKWGYPQFSSIKI
jgi:hypothetical protein